MDHKDLCEHTKIRLIAAALGHQQCTKTEACLIPLPGTDRYIAVGTADQVRALLPAVHTADPAAICDEVAAKSRNSLFRSGAKICAGEIRAAQEAAQFDVVDSEGGHHD